MTPIRSAADHRAGVVLRVTVGDSYAQAVVSDEVLLSISVPWTALEITARRLTRYLGRDFYGASWSVGLVTHGGRMVWGADLVPYGFGQPGDPVLASLQSHIL